MIFGYGYGEADYAREFGEECGLCVSGTMKDGPAVQLLTCPSCRVPTAVPREHYTQENLPAEVREAAADLLVANAEETRLSGMFDGTADTGSLSSHWRAHWRSLEHGLDNFPQELANGMTQLAQEAIRWFHDRDRVLPGDPMVRAIPDDEVRERIRGFQYAMDKEVYQTVGRAGRITRLIDPETMEGYEEFLAWYAGYKAALPANETYRVLRYDLAAMPYERQRALVERWERLHADYLRAHPELAYHLRYGYVGVPYRIFDLLTTIVAIDEANDFTYGGSTE